MRLVIQLHFINNKKTMSDENILNPMADDAVNTPVEETEEVAVENTAGEETTEEVATEATEDASTE